MPLSKSEAIDAIMLILTDGLYSSAQLPTVPRGVGGPRRLNRWRRAAVAPMGKPLKRHAPRQPKPPKKTSPKPPSPAQGVILSALRQATSEGVQVSVRDLQQAAGLKGPATVHSHLLRLEAAGEAHRVNGRWQAVLGGAA